MKYKIAFHSYKGGVGRTKVMVGLGAMLALQGVRVGMLDFDLDSSGLATIFGHSNDDLGDRELLSILQHANPSVLPDSIINVTDYVQAKSGKTVNGHGCLKYVPTISDPDASDNITFSSPMRYAVDEIFEALVTDNGIDLLLVDLKPGYSPSSALIFPLVNRGVVVTRLDHQNIEGLSSTVPIMIEKDLDPFLVVNMVPNLGENDKRAEERIKILEKATNSKVKIRIDYDPLSVFENDVEACSREDSSMYKGLQTLSIFVQDLVNS